jgi:hypothetical protein
LQTKHVCWTFWIVWRAISIQNSVRSSDSMMRTPKWWNRMCVCNMSNCVKRWAPSRSSGCCWSLVKSHNVVGHLNGRIHHSSTGWSVLFWIILAWASPSEMLAVPGRKIPSELPVSNACVRL